METVIMGSSITNTDNYVTQTYFNCWKVF